MASAQIRTIQLRDLHSFAVDAAATPRGICPISVSRAKAWSENPHADPDSIALVVAYIDDRVVGYVGLVPGLVKVHDSRETFYWLSALYVDPEHRDSGVGGLLLMKCIGLRCSLAASNSTDEAIQAYRALRFTELRSVPYYRLDLRGIGLAALPFKLIRKLLGGAGRHSAALDRTILALGDRKKRNLFGPLENDLSRSVRRFRTRRLEALENGRAQVESSQAAAVQLCRDSATINWMLQSHWVSTDPATSQSDYYFDDYREHFEYRLLEILDAESDRALGFAIVRLSQQHGVRTLECLDYHFDDPVDSAVLAGLAVDQAEDFNADLVHLPYVCGEQIDRDGLSSKLFQKMEKPFLLRPGGPKLAIAREVENLSVRYWDGDNPFA